MKALCELAVLEQIRIQIKAVQPISLDVSGDLMEIQLFSSSGGLLGTIKQLILDKWNASELPSSPGEHEYVVFVANPVKIWYSGKLVDVEVLAHLRVRAERYFGELRPEQLSMLKGEGPEVEMPDVEGEWQRLEGDEAVESDVEFSGVRPY